jgi:pimeloyl-ACP methyl ester carboxylesterase
VADDVMWLLLHGTPLTYEVWEDVRPTLETVHAVVAPQLPRATAPTDVQAEIAGRVLGSIGELARRFHVVGHSFGGQVALELVLAAPERTASLTVLCSRATPFPTFSATAAALRDGPVDVESSIRRWFLPGEVAADGRVVRYARQCLEHADRERWSDELDAIATFDRRVDLGSITVPTSIIASELDLVGTPTEMAAMAAAIPAARFEYVPNSSHMSQFTDPLALAERLISAIDGNRTFSRSVADR